MNRLGVFIIALFLLIPSGVSAEWLMFGNGAERNFVADITERTIQKRTPVPSWDRGSSSEEVYSWIMDNVQWTQVQYNKYNKIIKTPRLTTCFGFHNEEKQTSYNRFVIKRSIKSLINVPTG